MQFPSNEKEILNSKEFVYNTIIEGFDICVLNQQIV